MTKRKNRAAFLLASGGVLLAAFLLDRSDESTKNGYSILSSEQTEKFSVTGLSQEEREIAVFVTGEVNAPGLIRLSAGARATDAVEMAGGFTENADRSGINLAAFLSDGDMIRVPAKDGQDGADGAVLPDGRIDINRADTEVLKTLPGIGEAKAEAILRYREEHGAFLRAEDLMKVPGIGEGLYKSLEDRIGI